MIRCLYINEDGIGKSLIEDIKSTLKDQVYDATEYEVKDSTITMDDVVWSYTGVNRRLYK